MWLLKMEKAETGWYFLTTWRQRSGKSRKLSKLGYLFLRLDRDVELQMHGGMVHAPTHNGALVSTQGLEKQFPPNHFSSHA